MLTYLAPHKLYETDYQRCLFSFSFKQSIRSRVAYTFGKLTICAVLRTTARRRDDIACRETIQLPTVVIGE